MSTTPTPTGAALLQRLAALEPDSAQLDPPATHFRALGDAAVAYCADFLRTLDGKSKNINNNDKNKDDNNHHQDSPAFVPFDAQQFQEEAGAVFSDIRERIDGGHSLEEHKERFADVLDKIDKLVIQPGYNPASGDMHGYVGGGGITSCALGDLLAASTNSFAGFFTMSPGLVSLEHQLVQWCGRELGFGSYSVTAEFETADAGRDFAAALRAAELADCNTDDCDRAEGEEEEGKGEKQQRDHDSRAPGSTRHLAAASLSHRAGSNVVSMTFKDFNLSPQNVVSAASEKISNVTHSGAAAAAAATSPSGVTVAGVKPTLMQMSSKDDVFTAAAAESSPLLSPLINSPFFARQDSLKPHPLQQPQQSPSQSDDASSSTSPQGHLKRLQTPGSNTMNTASVASPAIRSSVKFGGMLTSGTSVATISAVVTARELWKIGQQKDTNNDNMSGSQDDDDEDDKPQLSGAFADPSKRKIFVVYHTRELHSCFAKALHVAGLGAGCQIVEQRIVAVDDEYRMDVADLKAQIMQDLEKNNNNNSTSEVQYVPWFIAASAGTVNTGSVDPLEEIANVARQQHMWMHCDGAAGALFNLCEPGRKQLRGLNLADSIACDPHKILGLAYGTGLLLVRNVKFLREAHTFHAEYLSDFLEEEEAELLADEQRAYDEKQQQQHQPSHQKTERPHHVTGGHDEAKLVQSCVLGTELSKHNRTFRLWMSLQLFGVRAFRANAEEKMLLCRYLHGRLTEAKRGDDSPLFELAVPRGPHLAILAFRLRGDDDDDDAENARTRKLHQKIVDRGNVFVSTTVMPRGGGESKTPLLWIRVAVFVFRAHKQHVDKMFDEFIACEKLV